jgi:hypothetical protein
MKMLLLTGVAVSALVFSACQGGHGGAAAAYQRDTPRAFNPQTGQFEGNPPYDRRSNKSDTQ